MTINLNLVSLIPFTSEQEIIDCLAEGLCFSCRQPAIPRCYSQAGIKEYAISGLCEPCFDDLTVAIGE